MWGLQCRIGCIKYPSVGAFVFDVGAIGLDRLHKISKCGHLLVLLWGLQCWMGYTKYPNVGTFDFGVGSAGLDRLHEISKYGFL